MVLAPVLFSCWTVLFVCVQLKAVVRILQVTKTRKAHKQAPFPWIQVKFVQVWNYFWIGNHGFFLYIIINPRWSTREVIISLWTLSWTFSSERKWYPLRSILWQLCLLFLGRVRIRINTLFILLRLFHWLCRSLPGDCELVVGADQCVLLRW